MDLQHRCIPESMKPIPGWLLQGILLTAQPWDPEQHGDVQWEFMFQDCEHLLPCQCQPRGFNGTNASLYPALQFLLKTKS